MAINLGRDMKFSDLDDVLKLMVTKWLPNKDKIKLLDIFPAVVVQIVSINSMHDLLPTKISEFVEVSEIDREYAVQVFKKLTHLKRIRMSTDEASKLGLDEFIFSEAHPNIEYIKDGSLMDINRMSALQFIADLHEADSNYDGSNIMNTFLIPDDQILDFVRRNPGLRLKLEFRSWDEDSTSHLELFLDNDIRPMIHAMHLNADQQLYLVSNPIRFESLAQLELEVQMPFFVDNFEAFRFLNPNIKALTITTAAPDASTAIKFANCVLSLEKLESLELFCQHHNWNDDNVTAQRQLVTILVTTNKPSLTRLNIENDADWFDILTTKIDKIRNGFKFLRICNVNGSYGIITIFELDHQTISMRNLTWTIIHLYNMFPHVKHFQVESDDELFDYLFMRHNDYFEGLKAELEVIRNGLPRNRWLTLDFDNLSAWRREDGHASE